MAGAGAAAAATAIGPVRAENQDASAAMALAHGAGALLLVADGMGGMAGGGEAARAAVDAVSATLPDLAVSKDAAASALHHANGAVGELRSRIGGCPGTTLTLALVGAQRAVIGHAGDSRAYLVRDGSARPLTSDHSWVGEQVRAGALAAGDERRHPRRNLITMAVMGDELSPEVLELALQPRDVLLLCSDGFWEPLQDADIATLLSTPGPIAAVVERAVGAALDAGATDNVTVLALRLP